MLASTGWGRKLWLCAAAVSLGGGIWPMHFVAMLAFSISGIAISYDLPLTLLSLGIALLLTGLGFAVMNQGQVSLQRMIFAGRLMGLGVVTMHYLSMAAMRMPATLSYVRGWFAASVLIAVGAATFLLGMSLVGLALGPYLTGKIGIATGSLRFGVFSLYLVAPFVLAVLWRVSRRLTALESTSEARAAENG